MSIVHTIEAGDTVSRIAGHTGFAPDTIWQHPANARLRKQREHMDVLAVGDSLTIPAIEPKQEPSATDLRHRFRRKGVPMPFVLQLLDQWGKPRQSRAYRLDVDGTVMEGSTDGQGVLSVFLPTGAVRGQLVIDDLSLTLTFGVLEPHNGLIGTQHRLTNLGFPCLEDEGELGRATLLAVLRFQQTHGLPVTGELDDATRDKLGELHRTPGQLAKALSEVGA